MILQVKSYTKQNGTLKVTIFLNNNQGLSRDVRQS